MHLKPPPFAPDSTLRQGDDLESRSSPGLQLLWGHRTTPNPPSPSTPVAQPPDPAGAVLLREAAR